MQILKPAIAALLGLAIVTATPAQAGQQPAAGTLSGRVTDSVTREVLPGAIVEVDGTNLRTAVSRDGAFILSGLPAGTHAVVVSYLGHSSGSYRHRSAARLRDWRQSGYLAARVARGVCRARIPPDEPSIRCENQPCRLARARTLAGQIGRDGAGLAAKRLAADYG